MNINLSEKLSLCSLLKSILWKNVDYFRYMNDSLLYMIIIFLVIDIFLSKKKNNYTFCVERFVLLFPQTFVSEKNKCFPSVTFNIPLSVTKLQKSSELTAMALYLESTCSLRSSFSPS